MNAQIYPYSRDISASMHVNANEREKKHMYTSETIKLFFQLTHLLLIQKYFFYLRLFAHLCGQHVFNPQEPV